MALEILNMIRLKIHVCVYNILPSFVFSLIVIVFNSFPSRVALAESYSLGQSAGENREERAD